MECQNNRRKQRQTCQRNGLGPYVVQASLCRSAGDGHRPALTFDSTVDELPKVSSARHVEDLIQLAPNNVKLGIVPQRN